jgi:Skp family chaperone for outer membrane proteins
MKFFIQICALAFLALTCFSVSANAQEEGEAKAAAASTSIAVVDIQRLMMESEAAKKIQTQVESYQEKFLGELKKKEEALREKDKELNDQRATLSKEDFAVKRKEFEVELIEARQFAQTRKRALDEASAKALSKLRDEILKVVQSIADDKKFDLVLARQHVVLGAKSIDISDESMKKLNAAIKDITVTISEN